MDCTKYDNHNGIGLSRFVINHIHEIVNSFDYMDAFEYHQTVAGPGPDDTKDDHSPTLPFSDPSRFQIVYKITCNVGFDTDFILIKATDEREAWNKFWKHAADEPNLNHDDLGSKENYEHVRGSWKKKGSIVSITIEPIHPTTEFLYIGGGRNV